MRSCQYDKIIAKRPAYGISPSKIDKILGKKIKNSIKKDSLIKLNNLK